MPLQKLYYMLYDNMQYTLLYMFILSTKKYYHIKWYDIIQYWYMAETLRYCIKTQSIIIIFVYNNTISY